MKKISLIAALAVSTMLSACGGGGGGGHSFVEAEEAADIVLFLRQQYQILPIQTRRERICRKAKKN